MELIWELCKIDQLFSMKAKCRYSDTLYTGPAKQIIAWWPINYYQQDSSRKDITQVCQTCMLKKTFLNLSGYFHSSFVAYDYISSIARLDCTQSVSNFYQHDCGPESSQICIYSVPVHIFIFSGNRISKTSPISTRRRCRLISSSSQTLMSSVRPSPRSSRTITYCHAHNFID